MLELEKPLLALPMASPIHHPLVYECECCDALTLSTVSTTSLQAGKTHNMANIRDEIRMLKIGGDVCSFENTPPKNPL